MDEKLTITVLYDAAEDEEKARAQKEGKPFPLAYAQVADALEKRGQTVRTVAVSRKIDQLMALIQKDDSDVIFNLCEAIAHSPRHEHNVVGILELFQKCFTGAGSAGWLLSGDKGLCKKILQFHGIRYPRFCTFEKGRVDWSDELEFPLIVKPLNEDASIGIDKGSVVDSVKSLLERISYIHQEFDGACLVEEFIEGREIYVGVLGNDKPQALPILEWDFSKIKDGPKIAGAEAKWDRESDEYKAPEVFPQDIPAEVVQQIHAAALAAFDALKLSGYARVDMRLKAPPDTRAARPAKAEATKSDSAKPNAAKESPTDSSDAAAGWEFPIIEVNPNCWLEKRSEFAMAARHSGLSYPDLLLKIITLARERHSASKR